MGGSLVHGRIARAWCPKSYSLKRLKNAVTWPAPSAEADQAIMERGQECVLLEAQRWRECTSLNSLPFLFLYKCPELGQDIHVRIGKSKAWFSSDTTIHLLYSHLISFLLEPDPQNLCFGALHTVSVVSAVFWAKNKNALRAQTSPFRAFFLS